MSPNEERFREQLVDYLYGELDGAQLAAFEAELAASPERRAELEALRATLRTARSGLSALNEDPPAHVRAAIVASEQATRAPKLIALKPWYRRTSAWVPTLAAAAAVAFAVLAPRPEHQLDRADERAEAPQQTAAAPSEDQPRLGGGPREQADHLDGVGGGPPDDTGRGGGAREEASAQPAARAARPKARQRASDDKATLGSGAKGELSERDDAPRAGRGYARPPVGYAADREAKRAAPEANRVAPQAERFEPAAEPALDEASERRSAAPSPSAPPPAKSAPASGAAASGAAPARAPAAVAQEGASESEQAPPMRAPDALVARAKEHADARRWADAAIAYRELLQRFPKDPRAASWRSELGRVARELSAVPLAP